MKKAPKGVKKETGKRKKERKGGRNEGEETAVRNGGRNEEG